MAIGSKWQSNLNSLRVERVVDQSLHLVSILCILAAESPVTEKQTSAAIVVKFLGGNELPKKPDLIFRKGGVNRITDCFGVSTQFHQLGG